jgi:hypothetical protein
MPCFVASFDELLHKARRQLRVDQEAHR